jgi:PAS domain-containing protein
MTALQDPTMHRWTHAIDLLRQRIRRAGGRDDAPPLKGLASECLTTCESLLQEVVTTESECRRLREIVSEEQQAWQRFFDVIPVACLVTDAHGLILAANRAAALFLNVSVLRLRNQTLTHYIIDREALIDVLEHQMVEKPQVHVSFRVRPREKAIKQIEANVVADPGRSAGSWIWFLMPIERAREVRDMTSSGLPSSQLPEAHAEAHS